MELFQVFWDDQKNLFLEFEKDSEEKLIFLPNKIRYMNLHFEISKLLDQNLFSVHHPLIVSIKEIYHSNLCLSFSLNLDEFRNAKDLQIRINRLVIILKSGHRIEYTLTESFNLSDLWVNEDCYSGYAFEDLNSKNRYKQKVTKERLYEEIQRDLNNNQEKKTLIIEKQSIEHTVDNNSFAEMLRENNNTLKVIANELKNLTAVLKSISLVNPNQGYLPSRPPMQSTNEVPIERRKTPPSAPRLIQGGTSSAKVLVIKEMKEIFFKNIEKNKDFNVKDILKPLTEEEIKHITLNEEELKKREEKAIENQIKRIEKEQELSMSLENLKEPK